MIIYRLIPIIIILLSSCASQHEKNHCSKGCVISPSPCRMITSECLKDCYKDNQALVLLEALYDAYSGSIIACPLPSHERLIAAYNAQRALKDRQLGLPYGWESTLWPLKGTFELTSFHPAEHTDCFRYKQMIDVNDIVLTAHGLACNDESKNVWRIINETPDINPWLSQIPNGGIKVSEELKMRLSRFVD